MTETEYLTAETRTKIHAALKILKDILPDYGITQEELSAAISQLDAIEDRIRDGMELEEDPE